MAKAEGAGKIEYDPTKGKVEASVELQSKVAFVYVQGQFANPDIGKASFNVASTAQASTSANLKFEDGNFEAGGKANAEAVLFKFSASGETKEFEVPGTFGLLTYKASAQVDLNVVGAGISGGGGVKFGKNGIHLYEEGGATALIGLKEKGSLDINFHPEKWDQAVTEVKQVYNEASDEVKQAYNEASDEVKKVYDQAANQVKQVTKQVTKQVQKVTQQAQQAVKEVENEVTKEVKQVVVQVQQTAVQVQNTVKQAYSKVSTTVSNMYDSAKKNLQSTWNYWFGH